MQSCFTFFKRFFVSAIKLLIFVHSCQIVIHLCFAWKALFQFLNLGFLSHSIRIRNRIHFLVQKWRNKNQIQEQRLLMWKEKRYNVVQSTQWAKQKVILIQLRPRDDQLQLIVSNLRPIKFSTLFSHELLTFICVSRHFRSHHPNKACLFLKRIVTS